MSDLRGVAQGSFRAIDERILRFVQAPQNAALRPLTGSFCTPFRGTLFRHSSVNAVEAVLAKRPAAALVLATNPNVGNAREAKFRSLDTHIATGRYGEVYWSDGGMARPGWQPAEEWRWKTQHYEALRAAGLSLEEVAFANYIPWGSSGNVKSFAAQLDAALLRRVLDFADELLTLSLTLLRPRVVLAMSSISTDLPASLISRHRLAARHGKCEYLTTSGARRTINYYVGPLRLAGVNAHMMHVPHPAAWKMSNQARGELVRHLAAEVRDVLQ